MIPFVFLSFALLYHFSPTPIFTMGYIGALIGTWLIYSGLLISVTLGRKEIHQDVINYGVNVPTTLVYTGIFLPGVMAPGGIKVFALFVFAIYFVASFLLAIFSHGKISPDESNSSV